MGPVICEDGEQVAFNGGFILNLILWEKNILWQNTRLKCISYIISSLWSKSVVFDEYLENPTAGDNTHKYSLTFYFEEKTMHF